MKLLLLILDGAGLAEADAGNAVTAGTMPTLFHAISQYGCATLAASGPAVGLDDGQTGNSEVGHLTIGAGHVIPSTLARIQTAFANGNWERNAVWDDALLGPRLHVVGLLSDAGVHGYWRTLIQAAWLARRKSTVEIIVHPVLDGVDSQAGTAPRLLEQLRAELAPISAARLGLVIGRKWFCDRSGNLELTRTFVEALGGGGKLPFFTDDALVRHVAKESEATFPPNLIEEETRPRPGETILIAQHRADRAVQAARMLAQQYNVFSLIDLDPAIPATRIFFPTEPLSECLALELRDRKIESVRIAEACKFPHVTRFFDGLNERLPSEAICIDSLPEAALAEHPEMSIDRLAKEVEAAMRVTSNRLAVVNIANLDQVGHLGRYDLAVKAAAHVDSALSQILRVCHDEDWTVLITSDHGNADRMIDSAGRPFGSHTERPVPFVAVPAAGVGLRWRQHTGSLANIAPTMLAALDLPIPGYMDASLLERTG